MPETAMSREAEELREEVLQASREARKSREVKRSWSTLVARIRSLPLNEQVWLVSIPGVHTHLLHDLLDSDGLTEAVARNKGSEVRYIIRWLHGEKLELALRVLRVHRPGSLKSWVEARKTYEDRFYLSSTTWVSYLTGEPWDTFGFDSNGRHRATGEFHDTFGFDWRGYDQGGYDREGFNRVGVNRDGLNRQQAALAAKHGIDGDLMREMTAG